MVGEYHMSIGEIFVRHSFAENAVKYIFYGVEEHKKKSKHTSKIGCDI